MYYLVTAMQNILGKGCFHKASKVEKNRKESEKHVKIHLCILLSCVTVSVICISVFPQSLTIKGTAFIILILVILPRPFRVP